MELKKLLRTAARGILAFSLLLAFGGAAGAGSTTITLLHVNDSHSHIDSFGPKDAELHGTLGGIAKVATIVERERSREDNVLLLHAGDVFEGDLCYNALLAIPASADLYLMERLGFDAMAVGNHELDGGPGLLSGVLSNSFASGGLPLLSANIDLGGYSPLESFITDHLVKTYGDVKVGIFGLTVPDNASMPDPSPLVLEPDYVGIAQAQADALRAAGADVVVLLSHLGFTKDEEVAANVTGIDFIVGGHDHFLFKKPVAVTNPDDETTLIFQAGDHYLDVGKLTFTVTDGAVRVDKYQMIPIDATVPADPEFQGFVELVKEGIVEGWAQDFYGTPVGTAVSDIDFARPANSVERDSGMGNLVTDAYREATGTPIGITANGWISEKIWAGPIVGADVFHAVSYGFDSDTGLGFNLQTLELSGADIVAVLEFTLWQSDVFDPDFFLQTSGLTFRYDSRRDPFDRVLPASVRVGGEPLDPAAMYGITVNDGSAALIGLLEDAIGITAVNVTPLPVPEYVALRDYIEGLGTVAYGTQGRIQDIGRSGKKK